MTNPLKNQPDLLVSTFERLAARQVNFEHVLWVVPRVESAVAFKRAWLAWNNRVVSQTALLSPMVQTADRLSQPRAQRPWLRLKATVVEVLKQRPLRGHLSGEQLWSLAQEYLDLAFRVVLIQEASQSLDHYRLAGPFAEMEAEVAVTLANLFNSELKALIPPLREDWRQQGIHTVVWFDDGEALPGFWLNTVLDIGQTPGKTTGQTQLERVELPRVGKPEDWQALVGDIQLSIAPDMTAQAQQAGWQVTEWLRQDPEAEVAIAVLDRVAARRLVPVLQQAGVLVDDRTGWRFSTSTVAGWFFDVLNTYALQGSLTTLEAPLNRGPVEAFASGVTNAASIEWSVGRKHTLEAWAQHWLDALTNWGLTPILAGDEAGKILLRLLRDFSVLDSGLECDAEAFKHAWAGQAEGERFRPQDVVSPVVMMPLLSTRLRQFKRVLVLGCAQSHFKESPPGLLPPAVAQDLGFSGPSLARSQKLSALYELLAGSQAVCISHCQMVDGKPESLLPEMQWLDILLRKSKLEADMKANLKEEFSPLWLQVHASQMHAVEAKTVEPLQLKALPGMPLPEHLRVTALEDWVACPMRFGLKHALPWPDLSEWGEPRFEQLRGTFVHKVLEKASLWVHEQDQCGTTIEGRRAGVDLSFWKQTLGDQAEQVYQSLSLPEQAKIYPFLVFFNRLIPRIAGKLIERSIQGWVFHSAEKRVSSVLPLGASGQVLKFAGRLDRMEKRGAEVAITDIKFKAKKILSQLAAEPEASPQLPAYQAMLGAHDAKLMFLGIDKNDVDWIEFPPYEGQALSWGDALWKQLSVEMEQFFLGHASSNSNWQLNPGQACDWCDARGVCRPDFDSIPAEDELEGGA
ncbi:MAG: PD-(D/E)XK nuclease family protein [Limnobacter sp.]|nr:PD-(D/E)XK nuclease family protein [Limnobacter sp.]